MSASVNQYIELYDTSRDLIGRRDHQRDRLIQAGDTLDNAFAPDDYGLNLKRLALPVNIARSLGCDIPAISTAPAAIVNDIFSASPKLNERLPEGIRFMSLRRAAAECPELIPHPTAGYDDAETRLNDLLWTDGVLLSVAPGVTCDKPLQLINIFSAPGNLMAIRRLIISVGEGASVKLLICDHTQDNTNRYLSAELTSITLKHDASLAIDFIEESSALTTRRATINATLEQNARLQCTAATLSCGDTRTRINVDLNGQGAHASVNGLVITDSEQHAAHTTRILHHAEHTASDQLFKYVADQNSHCEFNGRIIVDQNARFTQAYQTNKNLLASQGATMHAEPTLEIYCDEVKCSHGAATGQLDQNALFYMRQRGIPEQQARRMLMEAFVGDVIDTIHITGLRDRLRHLVERRFSGLGATCADCTLNNPTTSPAQPNACNNL
ncbi:MAG: Fe-S cluster assembly protein SufD [Muribaculaceae bacterium]|nr:Fe-S cluster assembly protein SufD [Muribaculaceae bacterium]